MLASLLLVQAHDFVPHHHHADGARLPGSVAAHLDHHVDAASHTGKHLDAAHAEIIPHDEPDLSDGRRTPLPEGPTMALAPEVADVLPVDARIERALPPPYRQQQPSTGPPASHPSRAPPFFSAA